MTELEKTPAEIIGVSFETAYSKKAPKGEKIKPEIILVDQLLSSCMLRYLIALFQHQVQLKNPSLLDNRIYDIADIVDPSRYIHPKNPVRLKPKPHQFMLILENALNKHYQEQSKHERANEVFTLWTLVTVLLSHKYFDTVSKQKITSS